MNTTNITLRPSTDFNSFLEKVGNDYLDDELEKCSDVLVQALEELATFMALQFWVWPEDQDRENLRFCMFPWGNMDRGWSGEAEKLQQYRNLESELREHVNRASVAFSTYRRVVKHKYLV